MQAVLDNPTTIESIDRNSVRAEVFQLLQDRGVTTPAELDFFFQEYLHITLPKKSICPNHQSPFDIICDLYFTRPSMSLWISSRGSGKTMGMSGLDVLNMSSRPGLQILHSAAIEKQSEQGYGYFMQSHRDPLINFQLHSDPTRNETLFKNESKLRLTTMTLSGVNSPHVPLLIIDEVELIRDWLLLQESFYIPQSQNGYPAQTILISTRKWDNGIVQRLVDEASQRQIKVYESCIFEVLEKCTRQCIDDPLYGTCVAVNKWCKGIAHECEGFYKVDDFLMKLIQLDEETLDAQFFCKKPVGFKGGLIYELWKGIHLVDWTFFERMTGYERPPKEWTRIAGVDFESTFSYVMGAIEPMNGRRWFYSEYYHDVEKQGMRLLEEHAEKIKTLPGWSKKVRAWGDPSAKQEIYELNRKGVPCEKCPDNVIGLGVDEVRAYLKMDPKLNMPKMFFIVDEVPNTVFSMTNWYHPRDKDGKVLYDEYADEYDHAADCVRYANYGFKRRNVVKAKRGRGLY